MLRAELDGYEPRRRGIVTTMLAAYGDGEQRLLAEQALEALREAYKTAGVRVPNIRWPKPGESGNGSAPRSPSVAELIGQMLEGAEVQGEQVSFKVDPVRLLRRHWPPRVTIQRRRVVPTTYGFRRHTARQRSRRSRRVVRRGRPPGRARPADPPPLPKPPRIRRGTRWL
jgi:hypothetical protein